MNKEEEFQQAFEQTVRQDMRFYDKGQIDWLKLSKTDAPCHVIQLGVICNTKYVSLEEYCDWFNTQPTDVITVVAERLGHMCASTYNALVGNAMRKYGVGVHIVDLFENNIKAHVLYNGTPSVADPVGIASGWASYKFKFAAASAVR